MKQTKRLTEEQKILLELISDGESGLNNLNIDTDKNITVDWDEVYIESQAQAVALLAFDSVKKYETSMPKDVYENWLNMASGILMRNFRLMEIQSKIIKLLNDNQIPYLILKGTSSTEYYTKPELRSLGDIDILIDKKYIHQVIELFENNGFVKDKEENECHLVFVKGTVNVEVHYQISGIPYGELGEKVVSFMKDVNDKTQIGSCEFGEFRIPLSEYHGLILLLHMQHHMLSEGLGLRHLCDWSRFVKRTENEEFWESKLIPFLKEIGLFTYAKALTKTCAIYIGGGQPSWAEDVDENLCFEIITDIFNGGNFGRKNSTRASAGALVSEHGKAGTRHGKAYNAFKFTHRVVVIKYPIVKKVFILYPFLYAYKIIKYLVLSLFGKRPSISKTIETANERKSIYDKLDIFETKK